MAQLERQCENCEAWLVASHGDGECRRMPPSVPRWWPVTRKKDWCMAFTPKIQPKPNPHAKAKP